MQTESRVKAVQETFKVISIDRSHGLRIQCTVASTATQPYHIKVFTYRGNWYTGELYKVNWFNAKFTLKPAIDFGLTAKYGLHVLALSWDEFDQLVEKNDLRAQTAEEKAVQFWMHYTRRDMYSVQDWIPADCDASTQDKRLMLRMKGQEAYMKFFNKKTIANK